MLLGELQMLQDLYPSLKAAQESGGSDPWAQASAPCPPPGRRRKRLAMALDVRISINSIWATAALLPVVVGRSGLAANLIQEALPAPGALPGLFSVPGLPIHRGSSMATPLPGEMAAPIARKPTSAFGTCSDHTRTPRPQVHRHRRRPT